MLVDKPFQTLLARVSPKCSIEIGVYLVIRTARRGFVWVVLFLGKGNQNGGDIWILNVFGRLDAPLPLAHHTETGQVEPVEVSGRDGPVAAFLRGCEIEIGKPWAGWAGREDTINLERRDYPSTEFKVGLGAIEGELELTEEIAGESRLCKIATQ